MAHEGEVLKQGVKGKALVGLVVTAILAGVFLPWLARGCGQTPSATAETNDSEREVGPARYGSAIWVGKPTKPDSQKIELTGQWQEVEVYPENKGVIVPPKDSQVLIWPADKEEEEAVTLKWQDIQDGKQVALGAFASFKIKGKQGEVATIRTSPAR